MANSRPLVRRDTLLAPPRLSGCSGCFGDSAAKLSRELSHFDGREAGLETFVAALQARAIDGLFERVAGQNTKDDGHAGVHLGELQASCGFRADVIVMRGLTAKHAADGDEGIVAAGSSQFFCSQRQFE